MAKQVPGKEEFHGLVDWFATMIERSSVTLKLNTTADVSGLAGFDAVVIATGVTAHAIRRFRPVCDGAQVVSLR
jgi:2,4-dienoyl-CoA reductase (NADPH2)